MDSDTDSDTVMDWDNTRGPAYDVREDFGMTMEKLADRISDAAATWDRHYEGVDIEGFHRNLSVPILRPQMPGRVCKVKDELIDSAFKIIELAAGPSGMIAIAISQVNAIMLPRNPKKAKELAMPGANVSLQVQFISAIKWLFYFKIFDRIPERDVMPYDSLADEANVPVSELKRMLRIAMANHVFYEVDGKAVCHNRFSWKLARDGDVIHGLPFFCDTVMPAIGKMVDRTTGWRASGSDENNKTARNLAFDDDLDFDEFLAQTEEAHGYTRLMSLLSSGRSLPSTYSTEMAHGTIDWYSLRKGAIIVDLFPHLRFHVHAPLDTINDMRDYVTKNNPDLLNRIEFRSPDQAVARSADIYLLSGLTHRRTDKEIAEALTMFHHVMNFDSRIIVIEPLLPKRGWSTMAMEKISQCRNITMWQLQNCADRTLEELEMLAKGISEDFSIESHTRRSNSMVATVVFRLFNRVIE
ncbi:O-methyltransferase bik3 [Trichoderma lentiforme]|uniref:O-methyltransferase bik3 n=1 Tax=Trichoderma lentiforme TaxID=1567552 RepID=A0A9P4XDW2_9HYPO|nr:O-methyltransferase bik3 [Trichoderma lentiforme]